MTTVIRCLGVARCGCVSRECPIGRIALTVRRNGKVYQQTYEHGVPVAPLAETGETQERGTECYFRPSPETFHNIKFQYEVQSA